MPTTNDEDFLKRRNENDAKAQKKLKLLFDAAAKDAAKIGVKVKNVKEDKIFDFADYPNAKKEFDELLAMLNASIVRTITDSVTANWSIANSKNDAIVERVLGAKIDEVPNAVQRKYFSTNEKALAAFLDRKVEGLNLSDRVWQYTDQFKDEIEMALDLGIKEGKSAVAMSMDVRQYLQNPNMLFRRVRDERGLLQLSKRAKAFHPGQGVYRSSYKNARRLTATENNIAYRTADYLRYQQMDFVVGIQICLSNNHTVLLQPGETTADPTQQRADGSPKTNAVKHLVDICDDLQGRYPKDFKFTGWHPHCRCHVITILKSKDEIKQDIKRLANGETVDNTSVNEVTELPKNFETWIKNNEERLKGRATLPYFIKDNQRQVNGILGIEEPKKKELSLLEIAEQRHAKRTQEQVDDIKRRYWQRFEPDYLSDEQKAANIEAYLQIEKDLGIKRGKPMTFTEANEMKGNPHYGENEGYGINCQTCVVAHELRLRGFDVSALANTKGSALEKLSHDVTNAWKTLGLERPMETFVNPRKIDFSKAEWKTTKKGNGMMRYVSNFERTKKTLPTLISNFNSIVTEDGRYHIHWGWRTGNTGHIITFERKDGVISFYDPQTGEKFTDLKKYFTKNKITLSSLLLYRVDTLTPNIAVIKNVLTKYEAKAVTVEVASGGIGSAFPKARKKEIHNEVRIWVKNNLPQITLPKGNIIRRDFVNNSGNDIIVNSNYFGEVFARNKNNDNLAEIIEIAKRYKEWLPTAKYLRIEDGLHHDFQFKVYETTIKGQKIEIKTKITDAEYLYNIRFI